MVRVPVTDAGQRVVLVQARMAFACIVLAIAGGAAAVLHYVPALAPTLNNDLGLTLPALRPVHTTFASLWIFGAAIAVIYHWLASTGDGLSTGDVRRFRFHTACWIAAGAGILVSLFAGVTSGREYLGFHPAFSIPLLVGWLAFAWSFLRRVGRGFWHQPVYVYFWATGICYFVYTFAEGHAYLLPWVRDYPVRDLQIQWKSCGTLVGSFNFLVYGSLVYVSERLSGDRSYGQSRVAFLLFGVGCLNSFTNYVHHTYHLPQSHLAKWIAFVVSMMEIVILLRLLRDIRVMLRSTAPAAQDTAGRYLVAAKWWTAAMLIVSLLISVPSLNSIVHGTHAVVGHAMGTELGIDTMILLGAVSYVLADVLRGSPAACAHLDDGRTRGHVRLLNVSMAVLISWLTVSGTVHGWYRYHGEVAPAWVSTGRGIAFPLAGAGVAVGLLLVARHFGAVLFGRAARGPVAPPDAAGSARIG